MALRCSRLSASLALTVLVSAALLVSGCGDALDLSMPVDTSRRDPAWSPDGKLIAFTLNSTPSGDDDISIMGADGDHPRQVTSDYESREPSWSPDGKQIAFSRGGGYLHDIYVMDRDGSHQRNLTRRFEGIAIDPAWSPDGKLIAFASGDIYVLGAGGTKARRLTLAKGHAFDPAWSPDGSRLVYTARSGSGGRGSTLRVVRRDGTGARLLAVAAHSAAWSPDGRSIAFIRDGRSPRSTRNAPIYSASVYLVNPDGTRLRRLRADVGAAGTLAWSPDGSKLVLEASGELYVMDADGSDLHNL